MPDVAAGEEAVAEGDSGTTNLVFTLSLSATSLLDVAVSWTTSNGTAEAGSDYVATSGVARIPAGSPGATVSVRLLGDRLYEPDEDFFLILSSPSNTTLSETRARGVILNDDPLPSVSIGDATGTEPSANWGLVFTVVLSPTSGVDATVAACSAFALELR